MSGSIGEWSELRSPGSGPVLCTEAKVRLECFRYKHYCEHLKIVLVHAESNQCRVADNFSEM